LRDRLWNLWQSAIGVVNRATTLIAIACAAFAVMQEVSGRAILPTWLWWSTALILLLLSGMDLQWQLMTEQANAEAKARTKTPQPDLALSDLTGELLGTQDPEAFGASTRLSLLFARIREAASLGLISVWGRKNARPHHLDFHPLERIPESHWSGAQIDFVEYVRDPRCSTRDARHPGSPDHYADLYFNSAQIGSRISRAPIEPQRAEVAETG
jgi:hypothetical protein